MVTVVSNPQGHKIIGDPITATVSNSLDEALITSTSHGMSTGDYVYVDSDIDDYNGFWYVRVIGVSTFKLREYATSEDVEYFQSIPVTYYRTLPQEWSSIFLPIVYKVSNDRWPVNTVDTVRTISSKADDNGYLDITASGTIKAGMNILEYVKISNSPIESYNGVWQIIEVVSNSRLVIDAPYTASSLSGANIQYYYNNYQVKVKIFAGLPSGHPWETKKPYSETAELSLTPDENNLCMFSVADKIQGKVNIRNNTTLYSLPLNLDAFTGYYISTAESYDDSDNYTITTNESAFTDDTFEGYAIAGKLPFKNVYAGQFSDYTYVQSEPGNFLTLFSRLVAMEDRYFDISFIKNFDGDFILHIDKYIANYLSAEEDIEYDDQGHGVYRIPIEPEGDFDQFCVSIRPVFASESITMPTLSTWTNGTVTADEDWTTGAAPTVSLAGGISTPENSEILYVPYAFIPGLEYSLTLNYTVTLSTLLIVNFHIYNASFVSQASSTATVGNGVRSITITFTATSDMTRIGVNSTVLAQTSGTITLNSITGLRQVAGYDYVNPICIDIISCEPRGGTIAETFFRLLEDESGSRLLEDGDFRIQE